MILGRKPEKSGVHKLAISRAATHAPITSRILKPFSRIGERLSALQSRDIDFSQLVDLPHRSRDVDLATPLWSDAEADKNIYILQEGHAYAFSILANGRRHISDIFGLGAICNWTRTTSALARTDINLMAGSAVAVIRLQDLKNWLQDHPWIANACSRHELARTLRISQRVRAIVGNYILDKARSSGK